MMFRLKEYQNATLERLREYLQSAHELDDPNTAFYKHTNYPYQPVDGLTDAPYVCLRVPTGGGKTLLATHGIQVITQEWLRVDHSLCLWLVPSNAIREQTLKALRDRQHPYRKALDAHFNDAVEVMDITEALYLTRATLDGATTVIVSTMAALRRDDTHGLRVYRENGSLMSHFSGLSASQEKRLDRSEGVSRMSLANVLRLRRPIVVVDEAHNARTPLSFDTLARFSPSAILELTATPNQEDKGEQRRSNVLAKVSALELKQEGMLKLPVKLFNIPEKEKALAKAVQLQQSLENVAGDETRTNGDYIRPVVLIQAQSKRKGQERLVPEAVKKILIEQERIPEDQIAIATGSTKELEGVDVLSPDCPLRYIITVQALAEGWDCPFAYVLCSLEESYSTKAVEQILGRVLRMPYATRRAHDALNSAYAVVATDSFNEAAKGICDSMIENGFEEFEAKTLVTKALSTGMFDETKFAVSGAPDLSAMAPELASRVSFDSESQTVVVSGVVNGRMERELSKVLSSDDDRTSFGKALESPRKVWAEAESPAERGEDFAVPMLAIRQGDTVEVFEDTHLRELEWTLDGADATLTPEEYDEAEAAERAAVLDMSDTGHVTIKPTERLARDLAGWEADTNWEQNHLVAWLCRNIDHVEQPHIVMANYLSRVVDGLLERGFNLHDLVRDRFRLRDKCARKYKTVRDAEIEGHGQEIMFGADSPLTMNETIVFEFTSDSYAPDKVFTGPFKFNKHFYTPVADMNNEEADCAWYLDGLGCVERWVRNGERKPWAFRIPLGDGSNFYPDFVARLDDGRYLVVEYKGGHLDEHDQHKKKVGELYQSVSDGKVVFVWARKDDYKSLLSAVCK